MKEKKRKGMLFPGYQPKKKGKGKPVMPKGGFGLEEGVRKATTEDRRSLKDKEPPSYGTKVAYTDKPVPPPPKQKIKSSNDKELIREYLKNSMLKDLRNGRTDDFQSGKIEVYKDLLKFIDTL